MLRSFSLLVVFLFCASCHKKESPISPTNTTPAVLRDLEVYVNNSNNVCSIEVWVDSGSHRIIAPNTIEYFTGMSHASHKINILGSGVASNGMGGCYVGATDKFCIIDYSWLDEFAVVNGYNVRGLQVSDSNSNYVSFYCDN